MTNTQSCKLVVHGAAGRMGQRIVACAVAEPEQWDLVAAIDRAINQTLSRTILTSGTALLAAIILYCLGGQGIHAFAFAILIGIISGTYSTIVIASPIVLWLQGSVGNAAPAKRQAIAEPL